MIGQCLGDVLLLLSSYPSEPPPAVPERIGGGGAERLKMVFCLESDGKYSPVVPPSCSLLHSWDGNFCQCFVSSRYLPSCVMPIDSLPNIAGWLVGSE